MISIDQFGGSGATTTKAMTNAALSAKPPPTMDSSPFPYTHACLHVPPAEDAGRPYRGLRGTADCGLGRDERSVFVRDGFLVLRRAVPRELVDAARSHVATARSNSWEQLRRLRSDDWRMHFQQRFGDGAELVDGHAPVLDLLCAAPRLHGALHDLSAGDGRPIGSFYTQVAFRTPLPSSARADARGADDRPGTCYHLDGQANAAGERFPDHFSVLVGVALSDQCEPNVGNFTVFPGAHASHSWHTYPARKRRADAKLREQRATKKRGRDQATLPGVVAEKDETLDASLPNLGEPHQVCLAAGDAVIAHVMLPHRGGVNHGTRTRELVFFRVQVCRVPISPVSHTSALLLIELSPRAQFSHVDYHSGQRAQALLDNPWAEVRSLPLNCPRGPRALNSSFRDPVATASLALG